MDEASPHVALFQQYRPLLFSIAYRMLGSAAEADDILQDAYVRFQGVPPAKVESPKSYLSAIVTRLCLNQLTSARAQRETYLGPWLPEPVRGPLNVASFVIGVITRFMPLGATFALADVNGRPTLLIRRADGTPAIVVSLEVGAARVHTIWAIANPDKLGGVA